MIKPTIGFAGTVNAMPMHYAIKFKRDGYKVLYIVEIPKKKKLYRPETHFNDINYPYPEWIKEILVFKNYFTMAFPNIFFRKIIKELNKCDVVFLNEYGISLAPYLKKNIQKIIISSGSDIDIESNLDKVDVLSKKWSKLLTKPIAQYFAKRRILINQKGVMLSNVISYFPKGFNKEADQLIQNLKKNQTYTFIPRYDVSFKDIGLPFFGAKKSEKLIIFSGVRFLFHKLHEEQNYQNKGNDKIIEGLSLYAQHNKNIEIHFVEKGQDVNAAKELCKIHNLDKYVIWHKQMSMKELINLYKKSDVCFDQIGNHWIGAIGFYALYMGKPLIANARLDIFGKIWKDKSLILNACTKEDVFKQLCKCENFQFRANIAKKAKKFAIENFDTEHVYLKLKDTLANIKAL